MDLLSLIKNSWNRFTVQDSNPSVDVDELIRDLEKVDKLAAERFKELVVATSSEDYGKLANIDVYGVLDPAGIESRAAEQLPGLWSAANALAAVFEWIRNILILVPITITWAAFWRASQDYAQAITNNPKLRDSSFLYLWETRFEGSGIKPSWFSFSETALLIAGFLALIILLTLGVHFWRDIIHNWSAREATRLRRRLEQVLWDIEKKLGEKRREQTDRGVAEQISTTVEQFKATAAEMTKVVKRFEGGARHLMDVTQSLDERLGKAARDKVVEAESLRALKGTIGGLVKQVESSSQLYQDLQRSIDALAQTFSKNGSHQENLLRGVTDINARLSAVDTEAQALGRALRDALAEASTHTRTVMSAAEAVRQVTELLHGQDALRKAMEEHQKGLATIVDSVKAAPEKMQAASVAMERAVEKVETSIKTLRDDLASLRESYSKAAEEQTKALDRVRSELNGGLESLLRTHSEAMQKQTASLVRIQNDMQNAFGSLLGEIRGLIAVIQRGERDYINVEARFPWWQLMLTVMLSTLMSACLIGGILIAILQFPNWTGSASAAPTPVPTRVLPIAPTVPAVTSPVAPSPTLTRVPPPTTSAVPSPTVGR